LIKISTKLPDVWILKPKVYKDFRGNYLAVNKRDEYDELVDDCTYSNGIKIPLYKRISWVESCIVTSQKHVFRGIHYSPNCWKIYQCLQGSIYYVFVNCDEKDKEFGRVEYFHLEPYEQILKHPRYGAGLFSLEDNTILFYQQSQYYDYNNPDQKTFKWNDPRFKIYLPYESVLSERDKLGHYINSQHCDDIFRQRKALD
jgi:dTDP-4-dehydrorhamnose 3,5-epimerase-like enzyme